MHAKLMSNRVSLPRLPYAVALALFAALPWLPGWERLVGAAPEAARSPVLVSAAMLSRVPSPSPGRP